MVVGSHVELEQAMYEACWEVIQFTPLYELQEEFSVLDHNKLDFLRLGLCLSIAEEFADES